MSLRTPEQYKASLRDDRVVYFRGQRVADVTRHPVLGIAVDHAALDFAMAEDPQHRGVALYTDSSSGGTYSRYFKIPQDSQDLLLRSRLIEETTRQGKTLVTLVKEIGTDCLFALHCIAHEMDRQLGSDYTPRVRPSTSTAGTTILRWRSRRPTSKATGAGPDGARASGLLPAHCGGAC